MERTVVDLHVERTGSDTVLRWVCHRSAVADGQTPPPGSELADLVRDGLVRDVVARDGDVLVRFTDPGSVGRPELVRAVHHAVSSALADLPWDRTGAATPVTIRGAGG